MKMKANLAQLHCAASLALIRRRMLTDHMLGRRQITAYEADVDRLQRRMERGQSAMMQFERRYAWPGGAAGVVRLLVGDNDRTVDSDYDYQAEIRALLSAIHRPNSDMSNL